MKNFESYFKILGAVYNGNKHFLKYDENETFKFFG